MTIIRPWIGLLAAALVARLGRRRMRPAEPSEKRNGLGVSGLVLGLVLVSLLPWAASNFLHGYPSGLKTRLDSDGICRQSQPYTCGPAAAVTALRELGFRAEEREIARLAHTSSASGTQPHLLAEGLQKRYGADGLVAEFRPFEDLEELRQAGLTLAVLRSNAFEDHCVAILGVLANEVVVGDPLTGLVLVPIEEFESQWQFIGIVLKRFATRPDPLRPHRPARRG